MTFARQLAPPSSTRPDNALYEWAWVDSNHRPHASEECFHGLDPCRLSHSLGSAHDRLGIGSGRPEAFSVLSDTDGGTIRSSSLRVTRRLVILWYPDALRRNLDNLAVPPDDEGHAKLTVTSHYGISGRLDSVVNGGAVAQYGSDVLRRALNHFFPSICLRTVAWNGVERWSSIIVKRPVACSDSL